MPTGRNPLVDLVRVVGMFFVMLIHSPVREGGESQPFVFLSKSFVGSGAVAAFFLLSGYLGAKKIVAEEFQWRPYLQEKWKTLAVPYLLWNLLVLGVVLGMKKLEMASSFQGGGAYFQVEPTPGSIVSALFGIGRYPIVYQFWFLRDLIVAAVVGAWMVRHLSKVPLLPFFLLVMPFPMLVSIGYYLTGCFLWRWFPPDRWPGVKGSAIFCGLWLLFGYAVWSGKLSIGTPVLELGGAMWIVAAAVCLGASRFGQRLAMFGPATFLVYAMHEPLQSLTGKAWKMSGLPFHGTVLAFFVLPTAMFIGLTGVYAAMERFCPRVLGLLTGSRVRAECP